MQSLKTHLIDAQDFMGRLSAASKLNVHPEFIRALHEEGRTRAGLWLEQNFAQVGVHSTFDLEEFLRNRGDPTPEKSGLPPGRPRNAPPEAMRAG